jgi:hypothetical protein
VIVGARPAIMATIDIFAIVEVINVAAICARKIIITVTIITECYWNSVNGKIAIAEQVVAMVASIVVIGAIFAHVPVVTVHSY